MVSSGVFLLRQSGFDPAVRKPTTYCVQRTVSQLVVVGDRVECDSAVVETFWFNVTCVHYFVFIFLLYFLLLGCFVCCRT